MEGDERSRLMDGPDDLTAHEEANSLRRSRTYSEGGVDVCDSAEAEIRMKLHE